jgi:hypothetical protein
MTSSLNSASHFPRFLSHSVAKIATSKSVREGYCSHALLFSMRSLLPSRTPQAVRFIPIGCCTKTTLHEDHKESPHRLARAIPLQRAGASPTRLNLPGSLLPPFVFSVPFVAQNLLPKPTGKASFPLLNPQPPSEVLGNILPFFPLQKPVSLVLRVASGLLYSKSPFQNPVGGKHSSENTARKKPRSAFPARGF